MARPGRGATGCGAIRGSRRVRGGGARRSTSGRETSPPPGASARASSSDSLVLRVGEDQPSERVELDLLQLRGEDAVRHRQPRALGETTPVRPRGSVLRLGFRLRHQDGDGGCVVRRRWVGDQHDKCTRSARRFSKWRSRPASIRFAPQGVRRGRCRHEAHDRRRARDCRIGAGAARDHRVLAEGDALRYAPVRRDRHAAQLEQGDRRRRREPRHRGAPPERRPREGAGGAAEAHAVPRDRADRRRARLHAGARGEVPPDLRVPRPLGRGEHPGARGADRGRRREDEPAHRLRRKREHRPHEHRHAGAPGDRARGARPLRQDETGGDRPPDAS